MPKLTKALFNKEIAKHGFELVRGPEGYFYWASLETASNDVAGIVMDAESVYVYRFDQLTAEQWRARAKTIVDAILNQVGKEA